MTRTSRVPPSGERRKPRRPTRRPPCRGRAPWGHGRTHRPGQRAGTGGRARRRHRPGGTGARGPEPRVAAGSHARRRDPARTALRTDPLRHSGRRCRGVGADRERAGPHPADPRHRRPAVLPGRHPPRDDGVRRQRSRPTLTPAGQPAVAGRGGRNRRLDGRSAAGAPGRGGTGGGCRGGGVHRRRPRHRAGCGAGLPAEPAVGGGHRRRPRRAGGLRDERLLRCRRSTATPCGWWCPAGTAWRR